MALPLFRGRTLRFRITASFVGIAAVLVVTVFLATLLSVRTFLEDQRIRSSQRQTVFALLFAREFLQTNDSPQDLVANFQIRQSFDAMVTVDDEWFATDLSLVPASASRGLQDLVQSEVLGYEIVSRGDRVLVFGAPLPPAGMDMYLFFPLDDIDGTMGTIARVMSIVGLFVVLVVALFARRLSRRILQPLAAVGGATQRIAEGLLETRLEPVSTDEVGQVAMSFNTMAQALKEMIEHERAFVAAAAHELRTPLAALHATSEVVAAYEDRLPPDGREALSLLREDLVTLRQLTQDLMEMSELDTGHALLRYEQLDVRALVDAMLRRRGLEAVVTGEGIQVVGDKVRLERIVGNLIENAFAHGEGEAVRVDIGASSGAYTIAVSDSGPGVAPEDVARLFDRFYKTDQSRSRDRGGVGLGLAIAKQNADLLGGTIHVQSAVGRGTVFTVTLPDDATEDER